MLRPIHLFFINDNALGRILWISSILVIHWTHIANFIPFFEKSNCSPNAIQNVITVLPFNTLCKLVGWGHFSLKISIKIWSLRNFQNQVLNCLRAKIFNSECFISYSTQYLEYLFVHCFLPTPLFCSWIISPTLHELFYHHLFFCLEP